MNTKIKRCGWVNDSQIYIDYHDQEWGVPIYDDIKLFEFLILEGVQAGLSWLVVLNKRAHYRKVFENFNPTKIIKFNQTKINRLLKDPGIIRNRLKIEACINNAKMYLKLQEQGIVFSDFLWQFVDGKPIQNCWKKESHVPANTPISDAMSKTLKKHGFKFIGTTICYAFMQAVGMVNDHRMDCFRYKEVKKLG
ncbi:MAG: DNA-3-methyladenine glycosylase I [Pseudomonadota bacterium]